MYCIRGVKLNLISKIGKSFGMLKFANNMHDAVAHTVIFSCKLLV